MLNIMILMYPAIGLLALAAVGVGASVIAFLASRLRKKEEEQKELKERNERNERQEQVINTGDPDWKSYYELLKSASAVVWEYDFENKKFSAAYSEELSSNTFREIPDFRDSLVTDGTIHPTSVDTFHHFCNEFLSGRAQCGCELRMKLPGSEQFGWYAIHGLLQRSEDGSPKKFYGQCVNIDASYKRFDKLAQSPKIDSLTNLNTRYGAKKNVNEWLGSKPSGDGALFLVDVDHFRSISENVGFMFGDELLVALSEKLVEIFPADSIFGRINNDEFVVYVKSVESIDSAVEYAKACCGCMDQFFINIEQTERVSCSVGISRSPSDGRTYEELFYKADVALYMAKFSGRDTYCVYEDGMDTKLSELAGDEEIKTVQNTEDTAAEQDDPAKSYNAGLLSQVIEMLFESRELSSSINMTISLIGRKLGFDYCGITEYSAERGALDFKYMWRSGKLSRCALGSLPLCCENGRYFYCRDFDMLPAELRCAMSDFEEAGVTSFVQCPVMDGAELCGFISYCICDRDRVLSEDTLRQASLVSKIIGGYLRQLRVMQDIKHLGETDRLTGTMSITRFIEEAEHILSQDPDSNYAIVYADIDRFKFINETYGFKAGDGILKRMAHIIKGLEGQNELVSRVEADKFVGLVKYTDFDNLMERLLACDSMVNSIQKTDSDCYKLPLRAGIYLISRDDAKVTVSSMVDKANLARKSAKDVHHSTYMVFDESMKSRIKRQKEIEDVMRDALDNNEFIVYFQPKFSLLKGQIVGAEALVRWNRPGYGIVPPDEFIPIFEDNGFIIDLDFHVLELVCRKLRYDIDHGISTRPISVNFSRVHLGTPDFIQRIRGYLEEYAIPANLIEIEITESALTDNEDYLVDILGSLHRLGLVVSMDDFGSGYSSLNLLKKLPFDVLKIDKDFFTGNEANERERLIIANVVNMARSLNIRVVSEGVETAEQADFLRDIKCDLAQGFLYAHPMDMASYEKLCQDNILPGGDSSVAVG